MFAKDEAFPTAFDGSGLSNSNQQSYKRLMHGD